MSRSVLPSPAASAPRLLKGRVLRGRNVHHHATVYAQPVDPGELAGAPFERALLEAILGIERDVARTMHRPDVPEFATIVRDPSSPGRVVLVWECHAGSLSRAAARVALAELRERAPAVLRRRLLRRARRRQWSPATAALVLAAKQRGIPCEPMAGAYLRLGEGALQRVVSEPGPGHDPAAALEAIFPAGLSARLPTALVVGDRGAGAVARDLDGLLRASGGTVGLATRKGTLVAGKPVDPSSHGRGDGALFLLGDPRLERLVCAVSPRRIVDRGLRVDHATVTAILDPKVGGDAEAFRRAIDVAVSATTGEVIVAADHPHAGRLARELGPKRVVLLSSRRPSRGMLRHLAEGGGAVLVTTSGDVRMVELRRSADTVASVPLPSLLRGRSRPGARRLRNAMFAVALAAGLGLTGAEIVGAVEKRRFLRR